MTKLIDSPEPIRAELIVTLSRGREFLVREEAEPSTLDGGDEVTALTLVGRLARAAIVRYSDDAKPVLDLFEKLKAAVSTEPDPLVLPGTPVCPACRHLMHRGRKCGYGATPCSCIDDNGPSTTSMASKLDAVLVAARGKLGYTGPYGEIHLFASRAFGCLHEVAIRVETASRRPVEPDGAGVLTALDCLIRERSQASAERDRLARIVNAARSALQDAGYPVESDGDNQLAVRIDDLNGDRVAAGAITTAVTGGADARTKLDSYEWQLNEIAKLINDAELLDTDDADKVHVVEAEQAVRYLVEVLKAQRIEIARLRIDERAAQQERDTYRLAGERNQLTVERLGEVLAGAGVPTTVAGLQKLKTQRDNALADARGLRRELITVHNALIESGVDMPDDSTGKAGSLVRRALTNTRRAQRWGAALHALDTARGDLPVAITSPAGGTLIRAGAPNESGSVAVYPVGSESGVKLGAEDARAFFLAGVRGLFPPAVSS